MPRFADLRRVARHLLGPRGSAGPVSSETHGTSGEPAPGFSSLPGEESVGAMTAEELAAWENRDVPTIARASDDSEARADEKQDATTSLNFPLHWTSAGESWNYLFDFSVACGLLAPRPDDLVLDFAAGTCWASELLGRLGVRTVSVNLSIEMMRRGRQRLAADSRLVFRDDAAFVAARGQSLPFVAGSFDGVLCMNALHHLPSYAAALREIHRVLKPGGRAVFSEPGTAHAAQPLSRFRMREESVIEKSVSLPVIRRLAMEAGFSRMRVVPLRSSAAYVFDYAAAPADGAAAPADVGGDFAPQSRRTCPLRSATRATIRPRTHTCRRSSSSVASRRGLCSTHVSSSFRGPAVHGSTADHEHGQRHVEGARAALWRTGDVRAQGLRSARRRPSRRPGPQPLPRDVAPGEEIEIEMTIAGLLPTGRYGLRYDMVVEGVTWFEFQGSPCGRQSLEVVT